VLGSAKSKLTMKLFLKISNLCDQDTSTSRTNRQTTCSSNTALCVASRCKDAVIKTLNCNDFFNLKLTLDFNLNNILNYNDF